MYRWYFAALLAAVLLPSQLSAQVRDSEPAGPVIPGYVADFAAAAETSPSPVAAVHVVEAHTVAQPQLRSRRGRTYMIAGAAALVAGLLIDGDVGTLIAAGGVALGVYGILLYY